MAFCTKLLFLVFAALAVYAGIKINSLLQVPPLPDLEETWWGPGKPTKEDTSIKPFKINVAEEVLTDLKKRLEQARPFTQPLESIQQQYGMNTNLLKEIVDFWKTKYDWREREKFLNQYPQYTTSIQGLQIHYIHVKPTAATGNVKVVPLLLLHGWPGSVREFYGIIPHLITPQKDRDFVFELIIPSLPGYGFSQAAAKPGLGGAQMAVIFKNLMKRLGFEKYYIQGGDWGALIVRNMALLYPENVLGLHSNMCFVNSPLVMLKLVLGSFWPSLVVDKQYESRVYPLSTIYSDLISESGYMHIQGTKPDTVGVALNDSPVGLAAYILEKFTTWTNPAWKLLPDGGLKIKYTYTDLLDNVMIYWVTGSITTSMRMYAESFSIAQQSLGLEFIPIDVPTACTRFPNELVYQPESLMKAHYPQLVHSVDMPKGGHFAAFEEPKLLADDIWTAVHKFKTVKPKQQT